MGNKNTLKEQLNVTIDKDLVDEVRIFRATVDKTLAGLVSEALKEYLQNHGSPATVTRAFRTSADAEIVNRIDTILDTEPSRS